jgi:hypothetical protein
MFPAEAELPRTAVSEADENVCAIDRDSIYVAQLDFASRGAGAIAPGTPRGTPPPSPPAVRSLLQKE